jgi:D-sedoheptulose 7-phosphate isomerase
MLSLVSQEQVIFEIAEHLKVCLQGQGKALFCGNGGSACEASHFAAELMGRYRADRAPLAAVSLSADAALISCIGNDYNYADAFARQVEGLARPRDMLFCLSTSGNSENILNALRAAGRLGVKSVALLGRGGGRGKGLADCELIVDHDDTARIQEAHLFILHMIMDILEAELLSEQPPAGLSLTRPQD